MKGKKVFYIALFFSVITILYGCNERNSRGYLEDRIGTQISRVYQTKNLEDLFEQFPNGFTIYQSHTEGEYRIKVELTGDPETKMIAGTIKKVNRKNREITSQVEVKYQNEEFSFSDEKLATELWGYKRFLFQEMKIDKDVMSRLKLKDKSYNPKNGSFEIYYAIQNSGLNQFFELDESEVLDISFYGSNSNAGYYYTVSVENKAGLEFNERVYD
ncbi:hypothetical protein NQ540_08285 [Granulicatella adiacens ATCC 49175]|uniref:Lipoprotein n=1 Tax=Granulicatella adiacens ATCC 49175 TaxID=638301 RepID=C8NI91_9LACT|nr:hypothetical protein [Granulicatella adiacens]EEW36647.1 hypothetical protein HMPREF0444_1636 [Granulicatella adiacens ATCC 49175]UAK93120.1 hypothetical protein K8O88_06300 [Granulicatella adiacens]UWP37889.1 hypothetical protein NQ540_08285 [Granulicatella adiacens ATCC 49175]